MMAGGGGSEHGPAPDAAPSATIFQAVQGLGLEAGPQEGSGGHVVGIRGIRSRRRTKGEGGLVMLPTERAVGSSNPGGPRC
jgi:hypothetical protein